MSEGFYDYGAIREVVEECSKRIRYGHTPKSILEYLKTHGIPIIANSVEQKPCPHCDSTIRGPSIKGDDGELYYVLCPVCLLRGPARTKLSDALRTWNELPRGS